MGNLFSWLAFLEVACSLCRKPKKNSREPEEPARRMHTPRSRPQGVQSVVLFLHPPLRLIAAKSAWLGKSQKAKHKTKEKSTSFTASRPELRAFLLSLFCQWGAHPSRILPRKAWHRKPPQPSRSPQAQGPLVWCYFVDPGSIPIFGGSAPCWPNGECFCLVKVMLFKRKYREPGRWVVKNRVTPKWA